MNTTSRDESFEIDIEKESTVEVSHIDGGIDTFTISGASYDSSNCNYSTNISGISTITLPSSAYTIGSNSNYAFNTSAGYNGTSWSTGTDNTVNITKNGIDLAAGTDITVDGQSLKEFMKKMEQRLAILIPDPAKLEKFEALKRAYEHYKTMESLCFDEPEED